jgi:hypothetical protein
MSSCAARNFEVRVSSATVDADMSVFSNFAGFTRHITPLSGELRLVHDGNDERALRPGDIHTFDGGAHTVSHGKCVDFNLIHSIQWEGKMAYIREEGSVSFSRGFAGCFAAQGPLEAEIGGDVRGAVFRVCLKEGEFLLAGSGETTPERFALRVIRPDEPMNAVLFSASRIG